MNKDALVYERVNNYTKFKVIEMLIEKYQHSKLDNLNAMEQLTDDVLKVLAICGLKFHNELRNTFEE
tara:strand:- start:351 stop:551 length:201 start_codon:yes stop_codon:yes gene_type:complete